jgi:hypothetical protein
MLQEYVISTQIIALSERYLAARCRLMILAAEQKPQAGSLCGGFRHVIDRSHGPAYESYFFASDHQDLAEHCLAMYVHPNGDGARAQRAWTIALVQPMEGMER